MARTIHGNLTGKAASEELRSLREELYERERAERRARLKQQEIDLIWDCIDLEGEESFWEWYDNDENVPPHGTYTSRIELIRARIKKLKKEK